MHSQDFPSQQGTDLVAIRTVVIVASVEDLAYSYTFYEKFLVLATLCDMFTSGL